MEGGEDLRGSHFPSPSGSDFEHPVIGFDDNERFFDGSCESRDLGFESSSLSSATLDEVRERLSLDGGEAGIEIDRVISIFKGVDDGLALRSDKPRGLLSSIDADNEVRSFRGESGDSDPLTVFLRAGLSQGITSFIFSLSLTLTF